MKSMSRRQLLRKRQELENERQNILIQKHDYPEYAIIELSDLEYQIACIDDLIEMENNMYPFIISLYIATIVLLTGIITVAILKH